MRPIVLIHLMAYAMFKYHPEWSDEQINREVEKKLDVFFQGIDLADEDSLSAEAVDQAVIKTCRWVIEALDGSSVVLSNN